MATSAAGVTRGGNRSFTTAEAPTGVAITPVDDPPDLGHRADDHRLGLRRRLDPGRAGEAGLALQRRRTSRSRPPTPTASGAFNFTVPPLLVTTHLRVVTRTAVAVTSPVTTASVAAKVGLKTRRLKRKRVRIEGAIWPAVPNGRVSLQRQTAQRQVGLRQRGKVSALDATRSRYRIPALARRSRATNYRVVVVARNGGANVPGTSRDDHRPEALARARP